MATTVRSVRLNQWIVQGFILLASALVLVGAARRQQRRWLRRTGTGVAVPVLAAGLIVAGYGLVTAYGDRSPVAMTLAPGVSYERIPFDEPRPQVFHLAVVDLDQPCLSLDTTKPAADGTVTAETGAEFVARTGALLAINVAYFYPIREYPYWKAYPRSGDPVTAIGLVIVDGQRYGRPAEPPLHRALTVVDGRAHAGAARDDADFMIPARHILVADGRDASPESTPYPRAVAGVDVDTNQLYLLVVDGKQPGYAEGSTYAEVSRFLIDRGVDEAVELDGGGSATLAATVDGEVDVLSRPSQQRLPGRLRPVATHLGVQLDPACP